MNIYLKHSGAIGTPCSASGMGSASLPAIVRGAPLEFTLKPVGFEFPQCGTWTFVFNDEFGKNTAKLIASEVTHSAAGIAVSVAETDTAESAAWIGVKPSGQLHGELTGFNGNGEIAFRLQILNWTYRNELGQGTPTPGPVAEQYYSKTEIDAKFGDIDSILDELNGEVIE